MYTWFSHHSAFDSEVNSANKNLSWLEQQDLLCISSETQAATVCFFFFFFYCLLF